MGAAKKMSADDVWRTLRALQLVVCVMCAVRHLQRQAPAPRKRWRHEPVCVVTPCGPVVVRADGTRIERQCQEQQLKPIVIHDHHSHAVPARRPFAI